MKSLYNRITGPVGKFVVKQHKYIAAAILLLMFGLGITSMAGNSAIVDEIAHIPAGYSYLHFGDYRLNPEHPPLIKDLAAIPLQFMNLKFPSNETAWTTDVNGQWETGWNFLYHIGNDADAILFWARLPILLLGVGFGAWLYWICRRRWGTSVALLALFFYALSPSIIANATLVTTDLGASIFMFLALITFGRFVNKPDRTNLFLLSLALAGAQLAKFSSVLLYPFLGIMTLVLVWVAKNPKTAKERFKVYVGGLIGASVLSVAWIWIFYTPHVWNMSTAVQDRLITGSLVNPNMTTISNVLVALSHVPAMKPIVQYMLGVSMVLGRVVGGNVTYFNGMVTDQSFRGYFPELFVFKTQVALLILMIAVIGFGLWRYFHRKPLRLVEQAKESFRTHVMEWTLGCFALFYFAVSIAGNLNLGIRHILPVYLPIFLLVAIGTVTGMRKLSKTHWKSASAVVLVALLAWYGGATIAAHPYYISYFNELIGGGSNAGKYFSDSSVDWGQDLTRLKAYVDTHPAINHIAIDYFGGGVPEYYFCQRKYDDQGHLVANSSGYDCSHSVFEEWHSQYGEYTGQYIAVSETYLENDIWFAKLNDQPGYDYLRKRTPIAKIGNSIYLYKLY